MSSCQLSVSSSSQSKEQFTRDKENINLVTLGSHQHGKTWLAAALSSALAKDNDGVSVNSVRSCPACLLNMFLRR